LIGCDVVGYLTPAAGSPIGADGIKRGWIHPDQIPICSNGISFIRLFPTEHLTIEDLGRLGAWGDEGVYSKPGRIQRILGEAILMS